MHGRSSAKLDRYGPSRASSLLADLVPHGADVLDIGCATGYVADELRRRRGCKVVGFEADPAAAAVAEERCDQVVVGDIESTDDRRRLPQQHFDVVLFGDVLEHLHEPSDVLASVRPLLSEQGLVVASIPNVAVWRARIPLMLGRFDYAESGIFDRTHLRFFTRRTALGLAEEAGYRVCGEHFVWTDLPFPLKVRRVLSEVQVERIGRWLANFKPTLFAHQFVLELRPTR